MCAIPVLMNCDQSNVDLRSFEKVMGLPPVSICDSRRHPLRYWAMYQHNGAHHAYLWSAK